MKKAKYILSKQMPYLADNIVPIIFIAFTLLGFVLTTNVPFNFFLSELSSRFYRNAFIVLSLVIPVIAGLGLNFGIVIGAMSGQLAIIIVRYLSIEYLHLSGFWELVFCLVLSLPIAAFIGFLTGKLYNKTRGQEMIASLIVGFFANGVYQFILLFATGIIIPVRSSHPMIKPDGVGVRMTVDMGELHYSLQNILKVPFLWAVLLVSVLLLALVISRHLMGKKGHNKDNRVIFFTKVGLSAVLIIYSVFAIVTKSKITSVKDVPAATIIIIGLLCLFTELIMKTKLGQDFRSVGQSQHIAESNGINVDKTRIIAVIMSTVLAAWGQIIYLQDMGTLNVYGAHTQIGMFSVAALLVGGASVHKATVSQALIGTILFNSMFIMSPEIGKAAFGNALLGEYFRTFMVYGIIGMALGIYVWNANRKARITLDPVEVHTQDN
ncbi:MAG TPA: ABC transporter permease [Bacillota bacterium]|nr:ABC transporter permease [Bacillota bacterium]HPL53780.1 ABC transporter permease [Bacillota bacterium]